MGLARPFAPAVLAALAGLLAGPALAQSPLPPDTVRGEGQATRLPVTGSVPNPATAEYPTTATADYVFGCMQSNDNSRSALAQCSCSFDVIATLLPFEQYEEASTFLSMGQVTGEKGTLFRFSEQARQSVATLRRAQAEAEVRCFQ